WQATPQSFAVDLQEALVPAGALLDQRAHGRRRLLARDDVRVVGNGRPRTGDGQAHAQLAVLGEARGVPTAGCPQNVGADEHGVAAEGMNPRRACKCSRERNQKKYSRQLRTENQCARMSTSWTPDCTTSAPVRRNAASTNR